MNEHEESRREPSFEAGQGEGASKVEPPRLHLVPFPAPSSAKAAGVRTSVVAWASGLAAGLALLAAVAAAGLYDHVRQSNLLAAKAEESHSLAQTVRALKDRIDAIEAARAHDETADLRKVTVEMKAESGATRDLSGALAQLTARLDRVDHDQSARLDKLEKRQAAAVVAAAPTPSPRQAAPAAKPDPGVSNETTGSIARPQAPLRGYWLVAVQDGSAIVDGRDGPRQVAPGDSLPGAGRVQRIERRGQGWVVVTTSGLIVADQSPF